MDRQTDGQRDRQTEGRTNRRTDKGQTYSPPYGVNKSKGLKKIVYEICFTVVLNVMLFYVYLLLHVPYYKDILTGA